MSLLISKCLGIKFPELPITGSLKVSKRHVDSSIIAKFTRIKYFLKLRLMLSSSDFTTWPHGDVTCQGQLRILQSKAISKNSSHIRYIHY